MTYKLIDLLCAFSAGLMLCSAADTIVDGRYLLSSFYFFMFALNAIFIFVFNKENTQ